MPYNEIGKLLIIFGIVAIIIGAVMIFGDKWISNLNIGKLPGDFFIKKDNFTFHFPIVTCIIISIILTIILNIFFRK